MVRMNLYIEAASTEGLSYDIQMVSYQYKNFYC